MESISFTEGLTSRLQFTIAVSVILAAAFLFNLRRPPLPRNAPSSVIKGLPLLGSWDFFTNRWAFYQKAMAKSKTGNFSFWAGQYPVVGVSGEEARQLFFDARGLSASEGYRVLLGGTPGDQDRPIDSDYFAKRLVNLVKGTQLRKGFPVLVQDIRKGFDQLENNPSRIMKPFDVIYQMVFQLTMRTVGCNEIANDPVAMDKMLSYFETIDACGDKPLTVLYPKLPTIPWIKRLIAGIKLYTTIDRIVKDREKTGRREDDAMQYLLDQGDTSMNIVEFIMGALFAGLLNTGINGAWLVVYLSQNEYWHDQVLAEIKSVADKYASDTKLPLREKLAQVPMEAWDSDFPIIDICLKDSIRLNLNGTVFRRNISGHDVQISKAGEVVPAGAFGVYHVGDAHYNPQIYQNPEEWDPSRYLPERAEDQKQKYAWWGWGVGRHPCLGMKFAKLESFMIVAFWFAYFESEVVDKKGNPTDKLPRNNIEANTAKKPLDDAYVKFKARKDHVEASAS